MLQPCSQLGGRTGGVSMDISEVFSILNNSMAVSTPRCSPHPARSHRDVGWLHAASSATGSLHSASTHLLASWC